MSGREKCVWTKKRDGLDEIYYPTSCGRMFDHGIDIKIAGFKYCTYCSGKIEEKK